MMSGIKDKVAIIGMGCTKFGELWDKGADDLMVDAFNEALADAGVEKKDIQAAWQGNQFTEVNVGHSGIPLSTALKLPYIPVTHVENLCASGTEAFRGACYAVASGACDMALAVGVEKIKDLGTGGLPRDAADIMVHGQKGKTIFPNWSNPNPGMFAMMAAKYFERYGIPIEKGKELLAKISVKSHHNGTMNPKAHLRREITVADVLKAPIIAFPLGLFDCCGVSDGAAAAIVVRADKAKEFRVDPVYVKSIQVAAESGTSLQHQSYGYTHVESSYRAALKAYEEAGVQNPRSEISMMEVHDCFSITELVTYEDLFISQRGKAGQDIEEGFYELSGQVPCQTDGGLKCFGHPIGASGLRMLYEMYKQLQGKAGQRQVKDPKLGLTHNLGGQPARNVAAVTIIGL
ncbi:MAG: acetyl-CoA acetyltransferase [Deltaproteobacteria bacterium]|nr:acetyl-CoA acetyltransferase [Deltaproteobacteria bacterium]